MKYAKKSKNYFLQTDVFFQKIIIESVINIKKAAAIANHDLGNISDDIYTGIISAINEIEKNSKNLKIQVFQTGSGTGLNMIINELISDYAKKVKGVVVHPNDHVNKGQSSNDVIPSALRISIYLEINRKLIPSLKLFIDLIENNYKKYMNSLKPGRTHLRDALPVTLGQELYSYYEKFKIDLKNLEFLSEDILQIPIGGTAVGTGYLSSEEFSNKVIENLNNIYNVKFKISNDRGMKMKFFTDVYMISSAISALAMDLQRLAQDLRLMYSGPNTGLNEIQIKNINIEGSSIMPGKTNPVTLEAIMLANSQILGINRSIENACLLGEFELGMGIPLIAYDSIYEIDLITEALKGFSFVIKNIKPNKKRMRQMAFQSPELYTPLTKKLGYDKVSKIIKEISKSKNINEIFKKYNINKNEVMKIIKKEFKIK